MKRYKAYKYRIYPNKEQKILINKTIGCSRYVFNHFLNESKKYYEETKKVLNFNQYCKMLTQLKKEENTKWLKEVDSTSLQATLKNLESAYKNFFKGNGKYPKFKSKKNKVQSYNSKNNKTTIRIQDGKLVLPKLGKVKITLSKKMAGRVLNCTVTKKASDKYFVVILCEEDIQYLPKVNSSVGIDLGLKEFAILSNETVYDNPKFFRKLEKKLAQEQRKLSRKKHGSTNYEKQRIKVAKVHEKITNAKDDYLQKISTEIVKNHDIICIEDLNVSNMLKNHKLAKGISEVSWSKFRNMLTYKCEWYGKELVVIGKCFPSSQLCYECGYQYKGTKDLKVREWTCSNCGDSHDRDLNASKNILKEGLRILHEEDMKHAG
ncbi:MAG: IS200/IS605 family element RNA-guided endonuclease TnpB [Bacillaceae bacterium]